MMKTTLLAMVVAGAGLGASNAVDAQTPASSPNRNSHQAQHALTAAQQAILPISAFTAVGDIPRLNTALNQGLDAGLTVNDCKEILVQMYAYTGFPRSLNALGELMKVTKERQERGIKDAVGRTPAALPPASEMLEVGTANQTKLSGAPVRGPLFEFSPAIDQYLKAHLFGDIFARDNLDWQSRELATVGALAAMTGVESQLAAHIRISMNVGLTEAQLREASDVLAQRVGAESGGRARDALAQHLAARQGAK